jgi:hypothetical protein
MLIFYVVLPTKNNLVCYHQSLVSSNILVRLVKFETIFTELNFYFVTQFMSKRKFYFETEGALNNDRLEVWKTTMV